MKRIVLITGGTQGLGKVMANKFQKEDTVIILAHKEDELKEVSQELECEYKLCDVTKSENVQKAIDEIYAEYNKIDILINNAGVWIQGDLDTNDYERIQQVVDVNTLGTIYMCRAVVPYMKKQGYGKILNVNSISGTTCRPERSVYGASKWAITGFTEALRQELAPDNIAVMGLSPALMNTTLFENAGIEREMTDRCMNPETVAEVAKFILSFDDIVFYNLVMGHIKY